MHKGYIVEVKENYIIVITQDYDYLKLKKRRGSEIGKQIYFTKDDVYNKKYLPYKTLGGIAAIIILCLISVVFMDNFDVFYSTGSSKEVAAVISVDINPSVEFEVNNQCAVIGIIYLNEEAEKLINNDVLGKSVEDAIYMIIVGAWERKYLTGNKEPVLISTAIISEGQVLKEFYKLDQKVRSKLNESNIEEKVNLVYIVSDAKSLEEARKNHISVGRYEIFKILSKKDELVTVNEVKDMKVQELLNKKAELLERRQENRRDDLSNKSMDDNDKGLENSANSGTQRENIKEYFYRQNGDERDKKRVENNSKTEEVENIKEEYEEHSRDDEIKEVESDSTLHDGNINYEPERRYYEQDNEEGREEVEEGREEVEEGREEVEEGREEAEEDKEEVEEDDRGYDRDMNGIKADKRDTGQTKEDEEDELQDEDEAREELNDEAEKNNDDDMEEKNDIMENTDFGTSKIVDNTY